MCGSGINIIKLNNSYLYFKFYLLIIMMKMNLLIKSNKSFFRARLHILNQFQRNIKRMFIENNKNSNENISIVKVNDIKQFGKKFNDEEVKKYLDPFGFLNTSECIKI
jgi:hypothetical protein